MIAHFNFAIVTSVSSCVVSLSGLPSAFVGQTLLLTGRSGSDLGVIVNLSSSGGTSASTLSALVITEGRGLTQGALSLGLQKLLAISLGDAVLGTILDPLGAIILASSHSSHSTLALSHTWLIENPSAGIIYRQAVFEPMASGLLCVDAMIPVGRGQRELLLGDRYTGKSSIAIDSVLNQKNQKVICIYSTIGLKASTVLELFLALSVRRALSYLILISSTDSCSSVGIYLSAYSAAAVADYFMLLRSLACLVTFDDLSKHAGAYREVYLLLRRPPGREAYPGEIFFVHSRLLERAALMCPSLGGGSSTAFPVIETLGGDVSAYIATNVISITDGQIFLSVDYFLSGIRPAIDVGLSVTRVGSSAQWSGMKLVAGSYKLHLAQFADLQSFSQFSSDIGSETKLILSTGRKLQSMFKQRNLSPKRLSQQLSLLDVAEQGFLNTLHITLIEGFIRDLGRVQAWVSLFLSPSLISN
jgi:F-type H+-transporting ATPase subunit alpha